MEIGDDRGKFTAEIGKKNMKDIEEYFKNNDKPSVTKCSRDLDISRNTIYKHIANIRKRDGGK